MRKPLILTLGLYLLAACGPQPTPTPGPTATPPPAIEAQEYEVYSALIAQNPIKYDLGSLIVIRDQTTVWDADRFERALEQSSPLPAFLVDSYRSRNAAPYRLGADLDLEQDYTLIREEDAQEVLRRGGAKWDEFRSSYPGARGMVSFSRVGFSAAGDTALVVMGFVCGDLCAAGGLYLVAKEGGSWTVQQALMTWMA